MMTQGENRSGLSNALTVIALLLAVVAAGLAFNANQRANEAFRAVQPVTQQPVAPTTGPEGTQPTDQGVNSNGNAPTQQGGNGIPPGVPTIDQ